MPLRPSYEIKHPELMGRLTTLQAGSHVHTTEFYGLRPPPVAPARLSEPTYAVIGLHDFHIQRQLLPSCSRWNDLASGKGRQDRGGPGTN